jgi:hypothetical protein
MEKHDKIIDITKTLNLINYQIAELSRIKEELEAQLNELLEHPEDGSKTYVCGKYKVTVSSGFNYSLNKEEYEILSSKIPDCFNPVKKKISYELDKSVIRDAEKYGSQEEVNLMAQFISKKPKKIYIRISAGV